MNPPSGKQPPYASHPLAESISALSEAPPNPIQQGPIPPPSHPKQYRAIGLIYGQYQHAEGKIRQGTLLTEEGTAIDAVLLGRLMSLLKKHLDLAQPHLWVVYPRTRQEDDCLHVQIAGVWEPETLKPEQLGQDILSSVPLESGYFSIRGEVIYASQEQERVIVKIRQSPKQEYQKPKFFKLKLQGTLPDKPVNRFWDLQVQLQAQTLVIQEATDLGFIIKKRLPPHPGRKKFPPRQGTRRTPQPQKSAGTRSTPAPPKPLKRRSRPDGQG
jgi:hypothetical protein